MERLVLFNIQLCQTQQRDLINEFSNVSIFSIELELFTYTSIDTAGSMRCWMAIASLFFPPWLFDYVQFRIGMESDKTHETCPIANWKWHWTNIQGQPSPASKKTWS